MEAALYRQIAQLEQTHWWFEGRRSVIRAALKRQLGSRRDLRILDVGCGTGGDFLLLGEFGKVEGIDASPEAIRYCQERYGDQFRVFQGMLPEALPREVAYDLVTTLDVIEHIQEPVETLAAIRSVLRADGTFV